MIRTCVLLASLLGCAGSLVVPVISNAATPAGETLTQLLHPLPEALPAPDFNLVDSDGNQHRLSDYRGRVVIINFWATWCPPCREEMPAMQRAWSQLQQDNIAMLAVNVGEDEDTVFTFTANYPVEFPLLLDRDSSVIQAWPVRGLPTTFVVDPRGNIVYRAIGSRNWDDPAVLTALRALQTR